MEKKYFIGLDIGTNSVGYAVTDENYNIMRIKGKKAWGVRLFDEASSAQDRRMKRTSRRRLDRRKLRMMWLNEIFADELAKVDPAFLTRLKYSNLFLEDKVQMNNALNSKDSLFHDVDGKKYTDKDYFSEYPTIYHLRENLLKGEAKDVRFLYLAVHNIIKRRGHFLYDTNYGDNIEIKDLVNQFFESIENDEDFSQLCVQKLDSESEKQILECIRSGKGIRDTKKEFNDIFKPENNFSKKVIETFVDGKLSIKELFGVEDDELNKISFDDSTYADVIYPKLCSILSDEQINFVDKLNEIYSTLQLKKILGERNFICEAMVDVYKKHKDQLRWFKGFIKKYYPNKYFDMFRNAMCKDKKSFTNYALYANGSIYDNKKQVIGLGNKDRSKEGFYKYVKSVLAEAPQFQDENFENTKQQILTLIENDDFLPKQRTNANGVFPNKLYEKELKQILDTNAQKFGFLNQKDDRGLTNYQKIINILNFKVPYFVGPIGKKDNKFGWAVLKNSHQKLYPWTLKDIVDFDKSEDAFIRNMTNKCTYLSDQDVLPKNSILYSKFRVLNEINNLKFNGDSISVQLKQKIFNDLFKHNKKVSVTKLKDYLLSDGIYSKQDLQTLQISGIDKNFANDFSSYYVFSQKFGDDFVEKNIDVIEKIILYHTIISDKTRLGNRIKREFGDIFTDEQIKYIKSLSFADWGRFSKKFLQDLKFADLKTGEVTSIIDELYNTNQNLQEILNNKTYTLYKTLEEYNKKLEKNITYEQVENLYCSPAVKRGVWQSLKIVNEIIELLGNKPDKIFVEVTRHDEEKGEKGRKYSRYDNLISMYSSKEFKDAVKNMAVDLDALTAQLNKLSDDKNSLRSEKLYLYFLQLGKCAYSGEPIDIQKLYDEHSYDVDHIIPQSLIKDDSIDNKVLVKRECNNAKSDTYPLYPKFESWINKQMPFWQNLVKQKLMSEKKYERLVRKEQISDDELGKFIARQLVETNQSAKAVIDFLKNIVDNPRDVVYSKASFVSEFRKKYGIIKCREVNDLHHAKDAYLNIVVGNVLFNRFTDDPRNFYLKKSNNNNLTKNIKNIFDATIYNMSNDEIVWHGENDVIRIEKTCQRNDCVVSRMSFSKMDANFYDETVYKSAKNDPKTDAKISLKGNKQNPLSDFAKYGGFNKATIAYFMLVQSEGKKGAIKKTIESVPVYLIAKYKNSNNINEKILEYLKTESELKNPKIVLDKINIQSTIQIGDGEYWLAGKTGYQYVLHNANQWFIDNKLSEYVKRSIVKYIDLKNNKRADKLVEVDGKVILSPASKEGNIEVSLTCEKNIELYQAIISQLNKPIYQGSPFENLDKTLKDSISKFESLDIVKQAQLLYNVIRRVSTGATPADLTLLNGSAHSGIILINKDVTDKKITLVIRSVTGLKEKKIIL